MAISMIKVTLDFCFIRMLFILGLVVIFLEYKILNWSHIHTIKMNHFSNEGGGKRTKRKAKNETNRIRALGEYSSWFMKNRKIPTECLNRWWDRENVTNSKNNLPLVKFIRMLWIHIWVRSTCMFFFWKYR